MGISLSKIASTETSITIQANWSGYNTVYGVVINFDGEQLAWWDGTGTSPTSLQGTKTGLASNSLHNSDVSIFYDGGVGGNSWSGYTDSPPPPTILPSIPTIDALVPSGTKSASIYYTMGVNTNSIVIELSDSNQVSIGTFTPSGSPNTGAFPSYSSTYYVRAYGVNGPNKSDWSGYTSFTTGADPTIIYPSKPTINSLIPTGKSVEINFTMGANTNSVIIELSNSSKVSFGSFSASSSPNTGLFPSYSKVYYVRIRGVNTKGNGDWCDYFKVTTGAEAVRPLDWEWETDIYQGASVPTIFNSGTTYDAYYITASEWNNFNSRIQAFLVYKGFSSITFTYVSRDMTIGSPILNQAISNINMLFPSNPLPYFISGGDIIAQLFLDMRDRLNSVS